MLYIDSDAVSTQGQQEFPTFSEVSLGKQKPHDLSLAPHPSDSQSVQETTSPTQPAVSQTCINYLIPVHTGLTIESQLNETTPGPTIETNSGLDTAGSVRIIETLHDSTQAPQMDSPIADKTSTRNEISVYGTSHSSHSSIDKSSNHLPVNETSIDKLLHSNHPPVGTAPLSSHPLLNELPSSHHLPGDGTPPSNQPPENRTLPTSRKHPPAGRTSPSSHTPIVTVDGTSSHSLSSVDETSPSRHPPMTYISPLSSHSPVNESQPSQRVPGDGTLPSGHPEPPIIDRTSPSNHPSVDKTSNSRCLPMDKPPPSNHPLTTSAGFIGNRQPVDDFLPNTQPPVEVPSKMNHPAESELQIESDLPASNAALLDQTMSDHLPVCKNSENFGSQVPTNQLGSQPPVDGKLCDKHTQHKSPSLSREEVRNM